MKRTTLAFLALAAALAITPATMMADSITLTFNQNSAATAIATSSSYTVNYTGIVVVNDSTSNITFNIGTVASPATVSISTGTGSITSSTTPGSPVQYRFEGVYASGGAVSVTTGTGAGTMTWLAGDDNSGTFNATRSAPTAYGTFQTSTGDPNFTVLSLSPTLLAELGLSPYSQYSNAYDSVGTNTNNYYYGAYPDNTLLHTPTADTGDLNTTSGTTSIIALTAATPEPSSLLLLGTGLLGLAGAAFRRGKLVRKG